MKKKILLNKDLESINPEWEGNSFCFGEFCNLASMSKLKAFGVMPKVVWKLLFRKKNKEIAVEYSRLKTKRGDFVIWLGHSSFLIQVGGKRIVTDPCFFDNIPLTPRYMDFPYDLKDFGRVDYILISHYHTDHCCHDSIKKLLEISPKAEILTGLGCEDYFNYCDKVSCAGWFQKFKTRGVDVFFMPAKHHSGFGFRTFKKSLWGSFVIRYNDKIIFFTGDSGMDEHFLEVRKFFPKIDYLLMDISWTDKITSSHLHPPQTSEVVEILRPRYVVPMHYGTFNQKLRVNVIDKFLKDMKEKKFLDRVITPKIGECFEV
ncbi:MAG: MBL fold metallo-hydrolase [Bacteroidales bacterium]|nr:MBL fold metallo-hydrolase [Bacteroidales bacterium]